MKLIKTANFELAVYAKGDEDSDKLALVLPGRLDTKDYVHMKSHVDFLAKQGYFALSFDMPGTWESPGSIKDYTTTVYIKVVNELIEHFGHRKTLLLGHSRGATVAILAGVQNENVIGIIPIMATYGAPVSPSQNDIKAGVHITYRDMPPGNTKTAEQMEFNLPLAYFTDGQKYNPVEALKKFKGPKLVIYGTDDKFTQPDRVREVFESLMEPKILIEMSCDHDYRYHADKIEKVNEAVGEFLDKNLKGNT